MKALGWRSLKTQWLTLAELVLKDRYFALFVGRDDRALFAEMVLMTLNCCIKVTCGRRSIVAQNVRKLRFN